MGAGAQGKAADLVTVIIPARNEESFIAGCLDSVLTQDYSALQIVVVDGDSDDRTAAIVEGYRARDPRVELIANPARRIPVALNRGVAAARGRYVVRVDAHATIPPEYVSTAIAELSTGRWGAVGGRVDAVGVTPAGRAIAVAMGSRFGQGNSMHHYGQKRMSLDHVPFPAYPVELLRSCGGWNEALEANEDYELDYRLHRDGHDLLFDPMLSIRYHCRQRIRDVFRQYHRYARGKMGVLALHPESIGARHLAAPALVGLLGVSALTATVRPRAAAALVAPYIAAVMAASAAASARLHDWPARVRLPLAFAAMHLGWGLGFWRGLPTLLRSLVAGPDVVTAAAVPPPADVSALPR